jgi:peptide/nickel transport system ATP-binding protein
MTPILELKAVSKRFTKDVDLSTRLAALAGRPFGAAPARPQSALAVDKVDLRILPGRVVGLVGESGCGKSTLGRMAVGLHTLSGGQRLWKGAELSGASPTQRREAQLKMQMIFQDPYASLNPRKRVLDIVGEAPVVHALVPPAQKRVYVAELLEKVGLPAAMLGRYPHQFSGGQRARVGIARALAVQPELLVCDESVAALDVSIQAQVLNLFMKLRADLGLTYLFISHDLGVVKHLSDEVVIMYLGRVVESGPTDEVFSRPLHPYAEALLQAAPRLEVGTKTYRPIAGEIPSALNPPRGCHFHPRCPQATDKCRSTAPALTSVSVSRRVACHLHA